MQKHIVVIFIVLAIAAAPLFGQADTSSRPELTLLVDVQYSASHGWGHVFECLVIEVRDGTLADETIFVSVYDTEDPSGSTLQPFEAHQDVTMTFARNPDRQYGSPPGFATQTASIGSY